MNEKFEPLGNELLSKLTPTLLRKFEELHESLLFLLEIPRLNILFVKEFKSKGHNSLIGNNETGNLYVEALQETSVDLGGSLVCSMEGVSWRKAVSSFYKTASKKV